MSAAIWTEQDQEDLEAGRELRRVMEGNFVSAAHMSCLILIQQAVRLNARRSEYTEGKVTIAGQPEGTWKITVEEVEDERAAV